jgi:class 3 adenylate cyclase
MKETTRTIEAGQFEISDVSGEMADAYRFDAFARIAYPIAAVTHVVLVFLFYLLGQTILWQFNILSVLLNFSTILLHRGGYIRIAYITLLIEFMAHAVLATLYIGWESGFFLFFMSLIITIYFVPFLSITIKNCFFVAQFVVVMALMTITQQTGVLSPLDANIAPLFLTGNLLLLMTVGGVCLLAFSKAIHTVEGRLQAANAHMARFSETVSEYLDPMLVDNLREGEDLTPGLKFITVFFADLAESTRLSRIMDQEKFGSMIQEFVGEMQHIVKSHRGYLEDISGDGIFGYIGNFESAGQEQDARDVVEIAYAMQRRLAELNPRFQEFYGLPEPLRMRIGISSGEAQVGKTSGARSIYTANGNIVNLGAKLEQKLKEMTDEGGILISSKTASLLESGAGIIEHEVELEGARLSVFQLAPTVRASDERQ